jgi:hypothetical protein
VATPRLTLIGTGVSAVVAGPRTKSPSGSNSDKCALHTQPFAVRETGMPWCGQRKLNATYFEAPVLAIPTGTPLTVPIRVAPPTLESAGTAFRFTESRPPATFFTAALAAAGTSALPKATIAQAPANKDLRDSGSIEFPLTLPWSKALH